MLLIYHNDADGHCAAAVVRKWWCDQGTISPSSIAYREVEYIDDMNAVCDEAIHHDTVVIVDFSFKPPIMNQILQGAKKVIWIDHHKTAMEYEPDYSRKVIGIRNTTESACALAWRYFFPELVLPEAVRLVSEYDNWNNPSDPNVLNFHTGLSVYNTQPSGSFWDPFFKFSDATSEISEIQKQGVICLRFRDNFCKKYRKQYGFETKFEGYNCFAWGVYQWGSMAFGNLIEKYPVCISFEYLGNDKWIIGLYSDQGVDVSEIAKGFGGGGHPGAAGFRWDGAKLPFDKS